MLTYKQARYLALGLKAARKAGGLGRRIGRKGGKLAKSVVNHPNTFGTTLLTGVAYDAVQRNRERKLRGWV